MQNTPLWIELAAITSSALAGALVAVAARFDIFGVMALGMVSGLGGGIVRDILLNHVPLALTQAWYIPAAVAAAALVAILSKQTARLSGLLMVSDAAALGFYALTGASLAMQANLKTMPVVLVALAACLSGGVIRDLLTSNKVAIMQRGHPYALAALIGILFYLLAINLGMERGLSGALMVAVIFTLRLAAHWLDWKTPRAVDITETIKQRYEG
jgi:uncharacterized membrane protein YeiH